MTIQAIESEKLIEAITTKPTHIETLSLAQVQLLEAPFTQLCKYINSSYSLVDLNIRQMHMPVKVFAKMIKTIQKNRKLRYLNLQDNTLVDNKADKYDLYLLGLGEDADPDMPAGGDDDGGEAEPKPNKKLLALRRKKGVTAPKVKIRDGPKINQEFILEALKEFMLLNQSLIHINLAYTGIDDESII